MSLPNFIEFIKTVNYNKYDEDFKEFTENISEDEDYFSYRGVLHINDNHENSEDYVKQQAFLSSLFTLSLYHDWLKGEFKEKID